MLTLRHVAPKDRLVFVTVFADACRYYLLLLAASGSLLWLKYVSYLGPEMCSLVI